MNILFVHQNFPGQFQHLVAAMAAEKSNTVIALGLRVHTPVAAYRYVQYSLTQGNSAGPSDLLSDTESKVLRGEAVLQAALKLDRAGFVPDVIVGHPGWGECLFLKDVWPQARLGLYCEFFYRSVGQDMGFDVEFKLQDSPQWRATMRLKNAAELLSLEAADAAYVPTHWQASTYPAFLQSKMDLIHDGVDTDYFRPNPDAQLALNGGRIDSSSQVVTFVARSLEPYRGFHVFMRALPHILARNPECRVVIVGAPSEGYGPAPSDGGTWQTKLLAEVGHLLDPARVQFVGKVPLPIFLSLMQVSTVHVYLTYPFVLSWSILQAMSCGSIVVASRTAPVAEVVTHEENGLLVDFFSTAEISDTVTRVLRHRQDMQSLRQNARRTVLERFDLKRICLPRQLRWVDRLYEMDGDARAVQAFLIRP